MPFAGYGKERDPRAKDSCGSGRGSPRSCACAPVLGALLVRAFRAGHDAPIGPVHRPTPGQRTEVAPAPGDVRERDPQLARLARLAPCSKRGAHARPNASHAVEGPASARPITRRADPAMS